MILEGSPDSKGFKKSEKTQFRSLFTLLKASKVPKLQFYKVLQTSKASKSPRIHYLEVQKSEILKLVYTFKSLKKRPKRTLCTFKKCKKHNKNAYFALKCSQIAIS